MKLIKVSLLLTILCISIQISFAQTVAGAKNETKVYQIPPEIKEETGKLLGETIAEINNLRTFENRISFMTEASGLMWVYDEKEGRAMFQAVISDFTQLLARYDAQLNTFGYSSDDTGSIGYEDKSPRAEVIRKMQKALSVRQQITQTLAERDARYALEFYETTGQSVTNAEIRKQLAQTDTYFLSELLAKVAATDAETALKYARKNVANGEINYSTIDLLSKLYEKDAEKGAVLGEDIVGKIKQSKSSDLYIYTSLLNVSEESLRQAKENNRKTPMLSVQSIREIADLLGQQLLARDDVELTELGETLTLLEKYAPARAAQIHTKFKIKKQKTAETQDRMMTRMAQVEKEYAGIEAQMKDTESAQKNLAAGMLSIMDGKLPAAQRENVIKQMREIIASMNNSGEKIMALSGLAAQIGELGDKELASDIMREASSLVSSQPVNYQDYIEVWSLAGGYAASDSDKAFALLENSIFRLNDTISAFIKVGEFMDNRGEIIEDGEVQMNGFGGGRNLAQDMLGNLGLMAQPTIIRLAVADFGRTKNLANKFDRPEVRLVAKLLILRSVLNVSN